MKEKVGKSVVVIVKIANLLYPPHGWIQDFHWVGHKRLCAHTHITNAKSLTAGTQGPLKGPGSSWGFSCSLVLSEPYF